MTDEQRLQMITEQLILVRDNLFRGMSKSMQKLQARSINEVLELPNHTQSQPTQRAHECSRSHPHENMDAMCELRTEIARLTNENARLKAQPAVTESHKQKPVAWLSKSGKGLWFHEPNANLNATPLYTTPPQRTWVGLTDEEIKRIGKLDLDSNYFGLWYDFAKAIEAKLKERNG